MVNVKWQCIVEHPRPMRPITATCMELHLSHVFIRNNAREECDVVSHTVSIWSHVKITCGNSAMVTEIAEITDKPWIGVTTNPEFLTSCPSQLTKCFVPVSPSILAFVASRSIEIIKVLNDVGVIAHSIHLFLWAQHLAPCLAKRWAR